MASPILISARDLNAWADSLDAQSRLPQLIRKLVFATLEQPLRVSFRAGEGVQLGGWDGIVAVEEGNAFVPSGTSGWELSASKDRKGRADENCRKRSEEPGEIDPAKSTFVFVTPRWWEGKDEWAKTRRAEGVWRDIRAYDAGDLEAWLEQAQAVHTWISIRLGKHPGDADDVESFWAYWANATQPAITADLMLSGRDGVVETIHSWLGNPAAPLVLQAEIRDEALAVFAAAIQKLHPEEQLAYLSRAVVVHDPAAWRRLAASNESLILIPTFEARDAVARATSHGHRVVIGLGRADGESDNAVQIPRVSREAATKALTDAGIDDEQARDLAALARRSLTVFRRRRAVSHELQQPMWARAAEARPLVSVMLAGAWIAGRDGDQEAIAALANVAYDEAGAVVVRWSNEDDPPVRRVGDAWYLVSKEDAWALLERHITRDDIERFEEVALDVLGTPDPRFDLPEDQRWMAGALGHSPKHSGLLRGGLADTLAAMGARGDETALGGAATARDYAKRIVLQLLERANADWRVWASLSGLLPLLAETAPDAFLAGTEEGLAGQDPALLNLFTDQDDAFFSSSPHTGLLWALECLAWDTEHLAHVALVLAKLARLDPGGKLSNRPQESLRAIFLPWLPQTSATLDQRLRVLDTLREREPEVAWRLLRQLLPQHHGIGHHTSKPRWRDWAVDAPSRVTEGEYVNAIREVISRMIADADESGARWGDLIEALDVMAVDQHEAVVDGLQSLDAQQLEAADRTAIRDALRVLISEHRSFPDAGWALPKQRVDRLAGIYPQFEPQEPALRYGWLFSDTPQLPEGREADWRAHQEAVAEARLDAVRSIHDESGFAGVLDFVRHVDRPYEVGVTLGEGDCFDGDEDQVLRDHLASGDAACAYFARGFAFGRVRSQGREWAEAKLIGVAKDWSPAQRAELLACLPYDGRTWDLADTDSDTERQYWRLIHPYGISDQGDVERTARALIRHARPYSAVDILAVHASRETRSPPTLIAEALEAVLQVSPQDDRQLSGFAYHVGQLLDILEAAEEIDDNRVAGLEWALLPLLGRHERQPRLLHRELARDPHFFATIVAFVYRAEGEEPRDLSEDEKARARLGYELLQSWRTVPGTRDDGTIDGDMLKDWVDGAREATAASGRGAIGDQIIGQVLSGSHNGSDGAWPHEPVRDVIEEVQSEDLETGLRIGLYNSRGVVSRDPAVGGAPERALAERYAGFAAIIADRWPHTARALRQIAETYRDDARREDQDTELRENWDG